MKEAEPSGGRDELFQDLLRVLCLRERRGDPPSVRAQLQRLLDVAGVAYPRADEAPHARRDLAHKVGYLRRLRRRDRDARPDELGGLVRYHLGSEGLANLCHYKNAKVDQAVAQIQSSLGDNAKLMAGWRQLEATLVNDLPLVFLASPTVVLGLQDRVHGVNQIFESGGTNLEGVYLTK